MTDCTLVRRELAALLECTEEEAKKYDGYIEKSAAFVSSQLIGQDNENDSRVVYFCAVRVYYQLALMQKNGDCVTSFKAGDVSYTKDNSSFISQARELLSLALQECGGLVGDSGFAFEVM